MEAWRGAAERRARAVVLGRLVARLRGAEPQAAFGARVGLSQETVSRLEGGLHVPTWPLVRRLAGALGVAPGAFDELLAEAEARTGRAVRGAHGVAPDDPRPWWDVALAREDPRAFAGLAGFAVACVLLDRLPARAGARRTRPRAASPARR